MLYSAVCIEFSDLYIRVQIEIHMNRIRIGYSHVPKNPGAYVHKRGCMNGGDDMKRGERRYSGEMK